MELWQQVKVNKWRRLDNPEVMGYQVAAEAGEMADFFENLEFMAYDTFATDVFGRYVEGHIRGYLTNEQMYDYMSISTTLGLHNIQCKSYGLNDFDNYMSKRWADRFEFARQNGI